MRVHSNAIQGEEEAYMYAADSDTDDERPLAAAAMLTVLYSSEEEHETPVRQKTTSKITLSIPIFIRLYLSIRKSCE